MTFWPFLGLPVASQYSGRTASSSDGIENPQTSQPYWCLLLATAPESQDFGKHCRAVKFGQPSGNSLITTLREGPSPPTPAGRSARVMQIALAEPFPPRVERHYLSLSLSVPCIAHIQTQHIKHVWPKSGALGETFLHVTLMRFPALSLLLAADWIIQGMSGECRQKASLQ